MLGRFCIPILAQVNLYLLKTNCVVMQKSANDIADAVGGQIGLNVQTIGYLQCFSKLGGIIFDRPVNAVTDKVGMIIERAHALLVTAETGWRTRVRNSRCQVVRPVAGLAVQYKTERTLEERKSSSRV